jgi:cation transport ATPase
MTKSGQAIKALLNLQAKKAIRINDDTSEVEVDVEELRT